MSGDLSLSLHAERMFVIMSSRGDLMKQFLEVKIEVPDTHVIIPKEVYEQLQSQDFTGQYYYMKDLIRLTGRSRTWLNQNFLNQPDILKRIEPFTMFPKGKGSDWIFKATGLREYLENEFLEVLKSS